MKTYIVEVTEEVVDGDGKEHSQVVFSQRLGEGFCLHSLVEVLNKRKRAPRTVKAVDKAGKK